MENKAALRDAVLEMVLRKVQRLRQLIHDTRTSNLETKSSMGDKYETGRELLQQEINKHQIQFNEHQEKEHILRKLPCGIHHIIHAGTLVKTDQHLYYISISLGEVTFDDQKIFCISPESPVAKKMWGKSKGDVFEINGISHQILNVW